MARGLAAALGLIALGAFDAERGDMHDVVDDPDFVAFVEDKPIGGFGGIFVFGDHEQFASFTGDRVGDSLRAVEARPLL